MDLANLMQGRIGLRRNGNGKKQNEGAGEGRAANHRLIVARQESGGGFETWGTHGIRESGYSGFSVRGGEFCIGIDGEPREGTGDGEECGGKEC